MHFSRCESTPGRPRPGCRLAPKPVLRAARAYLSGADSATLTTPETLATCPHAVSRMQILALLALGLVLAGSASASEQRSLWGREPAASAASFQAQSQAAGQRLQRALCRSPLCPALRLRSPPVRAACYCSDIIAGPAPTTGTTCKDSWRCGTKEYSLGCWKFEVRAGCCLGRRRYVHPCSGASTTATLSPVLSTLAWWRSPRPW